VREIDIPEPVRAVISAGIASAPGAIGPQTPYWQECTGCAKESGVDEETSVNVHDSASLRCDT